MIRILALIFILLFSSFALGESISSSRVLEIKQTRQELEREIERTLRRKHGYRGRGFANPLFYSTDEETYLNGLKKFKEALENTENVRSFRRVGVLFISDKKEIDTFKGKNGKINFYFPADKPSAAFIGLISRNPDNEPVYQQYLKEKKENQNSVLKKKFGKWFEFHEVGRQILCDHGGVTYDREKIKRLAERLSGKSVKKVEYRSSDLSDDGDYHKNLEIWFDSPPPAQISITTYTEDWVEDKSYVEVTNNDESSWLGGKELTQTWFDPDCNFESAKTWEYNERDLLWRRQWLDEDGEVKRTVYANRAVKSLKEIYENCDYPRELKELQEVAKRTDRVLLTVLDSGVDYNHPGLAFKISRPPNISNSKESRLETIQREILRLKEEKRKLQAEYNDLGFAKRWWYKKEYNSKFKNIDDKVAQKERKQKEEAVGWDFEEDDDQPYDYGDWLFNIWQSFDHGTHVAGVASDGSDDIAILPIRYPKAKRERLYESIEFAHKRGSRIVNISLGSDEKDYWEPLSKAIEDHPDMLFVVAAGNEERNIDYSYSSFYPAAYDHPNMLVVAAVDENNRLSDFSNYGKSRVDVAAPGEDIDSLEPENTRGKKSGTSMATPYVSRVAAKIKFINPSLTPRQIISIVRDSVTPVRSLRFKVKYGGVVNEEKAIEIAKNTLKINSS